MEPWNEFETSENYACMADNYLVQWTGKKRQLYYLNRFFLIDSHTEQIERLHVDMAIFGNPDSVEMHV